MKTGNRKPQIPQMKKPNITKPEVAGRLSLIPSIPFILVLKTFSTGIKGMNGVLGRALRATTHASPPLLRDLIPIVIAR